MTQGAGPPKDKKDLNNRLLQLTASGYPDTVRQALKEGADPSARDTQGRSGLHLAISQSEYHYSGRGRELVSIFLNRGVDINTRDDRGAAILHYAVQDESYNVTTKIQDLLSF